METRHYWEENGHPVKYENYNNTEEYRNGEQLGFAAPSEDEDCHAGFLKKGKQDPMSHRIIEKRRRDRMNNCLADLSRLIPPEYLKKGRGRVEKTEIIEMAIRHLKFLQERANAAERVAGEEFRAGFQEALAEATRFLELQGYGADGLCAQLAAHLQRHVDLVTKGEAPREREKSRIHGGSSSETASSSSSSHGYAKSVITRRPEPPPAPEPYEPAPEPYNMEYDREGLISLAVRSLRDGLTVPKTIKPRIPDITAPSQVPASAPPAGEPGPLDARRRREPTLRAVRKPDHSEDYLHSYKFKNCIERRFSRSQDCEAADMSARAGSKPHAHKRRRAAKPSPSTTSTDHSASTEEPADTEPQETSSESPHEHYDKPLAPPAQYVPVFALNSLGKYYVPLSVEYACLSRHLGPCDALDSRGLAAPLHPVTIHVNFQPCLDYHVKREPSEREWRPA